MSLQEHTTWYLAFNPVTEAASKAVELDSTLADAHVMLAAGKMHTRWKWREAEQSFRHAIHFGPEQCGLLHGFAHFLPWPTGARNPPRRAAVCGRWFDAT